MAQNLNMSKNSPALCRVLEAGWLSVLAATGGIVQSDVSDTTRSIVQNSDTFVLDYESDSVLGSGANQGCSSDDLVGSLECDVTDNMDASGSTELLPSSSISYAEYQVTAHLQKDNNGYWISLFTDAGRLDLTQEIGPMARAQLDREAKDFAALLDAWHYKLSDEEVVILENGEGILVDLHSTLTALRLWKLAKYPELIVDVSNAAPAKLRIDLSRTGAQAAVSNPLKTHEDVEYSLTVTNISQTRVFDPSLTLSFGDAGMSEMSRQAQVLPFGGGSSAGAFDPTCQGALAITCTLAPRDRQQNGSPFLEAGESTRILLRVRPLSGGAAAIKAVARGSDSDGMEVWARWHEAMDIVGPILGLRLIDVSPQAYGETPDLGLPLHEGKDVRLRFAIESSPNGGNARNVMFRTTPQSGRIVSAVQTKGSGFSCTAQTVNAQSVSTDELVCGFQQIGSGQSAEIDVTVKQDRGFGVGVTLEAPENDLTVTYMAGWDVDPHVSKGHSPADRTSAGRSLAVNFGIFNRGRATIDGSVLVLRPEASVSRSDEAAQIDIGTVTGCKSVSRSSEGLRCALYPFSHSEKTAITTLTTPIPEGPEGEKVGLSWELEVPGYSFPELSTSNERGTVLLDVVAPLADLYAKPYKVPFAMQHERGVAFVYVTVGNQGTVWQDTYTVRAKASITASDAQTGSAPRIRTAFIGELGKKSGVFACDYNGLEATCDVDPSADQPLRSGGNLVLVLAIDPGGIANGDLEYEVSVSEGLGEAGNVALTKNNTYVGKAEILFDQGKTADLEVFYGGGLSVSPSEITEEPVIVLNNGPLAQPGVVAKLELEPSSPDQPDATKHELVSVSASIPSLAEPGKDRVFPCLIVANSASCALGELGSGDFAQIDFSWSPRGALGPFTLKGFVGQGFGEERARSLENNQFSHNIQVFVPK